MVQDQWTLKEHSSRVATVGPLPRACEPEPRCSGRRKNARVHDIGKKARHSTPCATLRKMHTCSKRAARRRPRTRRTLRAQCVPVSTVCVCREGGGRGSRICSNHALLGTHPLLCHLSGSAQAAYGVTQYTAKGTGRQSDIHSDVTSSVCFQARWVVCGVRRGRWWWPKGPGRDRALAQRRFDGVAS